MSTLSSLCEEVLRSNDRGGYTVPSPHLYPHQWAWDSAFAAIGWAYIDMNRALLEIETLMAGAWEDGRVPHILFHDLEGDYFPGPAFWETTRSSSITQPPVWATALRRLVEMGADRARAAKLLPAIEASHRFFGKARDPKGIDCVAVVHPWESGLDNSPAWDLGMSSIDIANAPSFTRVDKDRVQDASQRPTDEDYKRYTVLVKGIAADAFGPGLFAVYDPLMTTLLARAEADLAWLANSLGVPSAAAQRSIQLGKGLDALWCAEKARYGFLDARSGLLGCDDVLAAYAPLMLEADAGHSQTLRGGLQKYLGCEYPLPSTSPEHPRFDSRCYWRGPTWINMNWLMAPALDGDLVAKTIRLVEKEGFREYYDPETGEGLGAEQFVWTAALVLDWLNR